MSHWTDAADDVMRELHLRSYPEGKCWIGTTTDSPPKWEVSNGPVGARGESCEWDSPKEAIDYARWLGLQVLFEEDFRWPEGPGPRELGRDDVEVILVAEEEEIPVEGGDEKTAKTMDAVMR